METSSEQRNALLSVHNKKELVRFVLKLKVLGFNIFATTGTAKYLKNMGIEVTDIADIVGEPILGHRVVTLSREIHAGLLSRDTEEDRAELIELSVPWFDLLCVDMCPLEAEILRPGSTQESIIEMIDIGGPTMIR